MVICFFGSSKELILGIQLEAQVTLASAVVKKHHQPRLMFLHSGVPSTLGVAKSSFMPPIPPPHRNTSNGQFWLLLCFLINMLRTVVRYLYAFFPLKVPIIFI